MRHSSLLAALVVAVLALGAQSAAAASCTARAGSSAVDQYCEAIPSATGGQLSKQDADASTGTRAAVPAPTSTQLNGAGADGAAVLELSGKRAISKPAGKSSVRPRTEAKRQTKTTTAPAAASPPVKPLEGADRPGGVLKAVAVSAKSGPAASGALVWTLLATTLFVGGSAWLKYRRRRA